MRACRERSTSSPERRPRRARAGRAAQSYRRRAGGWERADADTKFEVLSLLNITITALRDRAGLASIDDPLPDEESSAFLIIRELFR
jgi:hypothetical protein